MELNLQVKAKTDGLMQDGRHFCYAGYVYFASVVGHPEDGNYYFVSDEVELHEMDEEFFDKYYEVIK
jgi:hypothetical protein